ncbi:hypothetical protein Tco_0662776 [Tanacetum coccineum]
MFEKTSCCRKSTDLVVLYISFRQALKLQYALSGKTVTELHALLINFEKGLKDKAPTPQVFIIQKGRDNKPKPQANKKVKGKGNADKTSKVVPYHQSLSPNPLKEKGKILIRIKGLYHCHVAGHWKGNCPLYSMSLRANRRSLIPGFKEERKLSYGDQYLQVGNGTQAAVEAI